MVAMTPSEFNLVSRATIFSGFKRVLLQRIIKSSIVVPTSNQQILFRQGDEASAFFIIIRGAVRLYQSTADGKEGVIDILTKGESFAVGDVLNGRCHHATAQAVSNTRVLRVHADHFVHSLRDEPDIALAVMTSTFDHLHRLMRKVAQLKMQTALQRLAEFLVSLHTVGDGPCVITLPYGKKSLAEQLGITPESLSRTFAILKSAGVNTRGTRIEVKDVGRLRRIASEDQSELTESLVYPQKLLENQY